MRFLTLVFLLGFITQMAFGQAPSESPPPLPTGPLLKRTPEFSAWTVVSGIGAGEMTVAPSSTGPGGTTSKDTKKPRIVRQASVIKTGSIIYEQLVENTGRRREVWHSYGLQLLLPSKEKAPMVFPDFGGGDIYTPNYAVSDFAGLDWISPSTYIGLKKVSGRDCIIFQGEVSELAVDERREMEFESDRARSAANFEALKAGEPAPVPEAPAAKYSGKVAAMACIDLETRLPLAATFGKETRTYQYGPPPTSTLALPPALAAAKNEFQNRIQSLARLPAKP